ncbi:6-phosphogluconate dehydrogenase [Psychromonas sp. CNPT3]|uniref:NAD(P)-dependent oxidoreductase n=1 Tax=Psychromonas sp. CNPT3 TaxID=314282 RepID=UPI00006E9CD0|nr:NAD(P)-dependent oxidoreductase [Psychromonas sp. CNPT3]AGH81908.1 6-phosphogluconate dehydrogenase [Psychromonas sp. CNPT3]
MQPIKVSFVGLGVMGMPMASYLQKNGYVTTVFNRTTQKAKQWAQKNQGEYALTPKSAVENAQVVFICVGNDDDVRSVLYGEEGVLAGLKKDTILVDHTTTSASLAQEIAEKCKALNIHFVDAPVSGGQAGAELGKLTVMCGGEPAVFEKLQPLFKCYAKQTSLMGKNGQGQRAKMVNQVCIAGVLKGLSEALSLAKEANLDIELLTDTLKYGAAGSWQLENRAVSMQNDKFDFGFAIDWMIKDLGFCLDEAKKYDLDLPMTREVNENYKALSAQGLGKMDTSALIKYQR